MTRLKLTSLHQLLLLIPLLCGLHACREPPALIYDPNHLIDVQVGADHYLIPLQNRTKPNTGSPSHIISDNGNTSGAARVSNTILAIRLRLTPPTPNTKIHNNPSTARCFRQSNTNRH